MPPANRTTPTPSGPIKHGRIGARDCDSSIVSAFSRSEASNPRGCCRLRKRHLRICRKSPPRPRARASNPRECCEFEKRHLRICRKLPSRPPSVTSIPRHCGALRKRTPPLARERSQGRSESTVICRADGGRVAQITGPSALDGRILDSVAVFAGGPAGTAILRVKHVTLAMRDVTFPIVLRIPTEKDDFAREPSQKVSGRHGVCDRSTRQAK